MVKKHAIIRNSAGIHVRPSGIIYENVKDYPGQIDIIFNGETYTLNSIMVLLAMGLVQGSEIDIAVAGPEEEKKCDELCGLFEKEYDFPPRE